MSPLVDVTEQKRLNEAREARIPWKKWGPYLSERQWGTVREDYSTDGNAWDYFTHDQARSRSLPMGRRRDRRNLRRQAASVFCDRLVERARPDSEGAAVRPYQQRGQPRRRRQGVYFYVDSTPTHSYMKICTSTPARVSLRRPDRHQSPAIAGRVRIRAARYRCLRRRPVFRRVRRVPRKTAPTTSSSASPCTIADPRRPGFASCPPCGSAIPGPGAGIR